MHILSLSPLGSSGETEEQKAQCLCGGTHGGVGVRAQHADPNAHAQNHWDTAWSFRK